MLAGVRIIIVDDEPMQAFALEEMAEELGLEVVGTAHGELDAFPLIERTAPDVAVLDINLGLATSYALASACWDRGTRVVFVTGYQSSSVPSLCRRAPILTKPFTLSQFAESLEALQVAA